MISRRDFLKDSLAVVSLGVAVPGVFGRRSSPRRPRRAAGSRWPARRWSSCSSPAASTA